MQDSSTNPFIPQENQSSRAATQTLSSPLKRIVKTLLIITIVLTVLVGAGLIFVVPRTSVEDAAARIELANAVQPPGQLSRLVPVKSTLGYTLKYDNQLFTSYAETVAPVDAAGKQGSSAYYENDDLRTPRDYNLVRITPAESTESNRAAVADPPQLVVSSAISAEELKANETKPDYKGLSQLSLFVQLSTDKRLASKTSDDGLTVSIDATKPSSQTINDVKYQRVRYTTKNENYRIVNQKYDDCYYTIQNETPVSACISNVRPQSRDDATLVENALQSLSFQKKTLEATNDVKDTAASTQATPAPQVVSKEEEQLPLETIKPVYNTNFQTLAAIAKNQPSTVRIGTLYCTDLNLKVASGSVITTLTDACVGNISSGTIVSKDGYIATSGHAVRYDPKAAINGYINFAGSQQELLERLDRVLDYLVKANVMFDSDADYLRLGAQTGDQEALAKIENIGSIIPDNYVTPVKDEYTYAIQPTNKALVLDSSTGSRPAFAYSDSVIAAKYVASDYDTKESKQETFDASAPKKDIGLIKAEGDFQNAVLHASADPKANDPISVLGYPSFSDSSLVIGKNQNSPITTNGKVNQAYDKDGQKLVQLTVPVLPGTDGGGAYDQSARLIGVSVYRLGYCPDQQCFASGTVRSISELTSLLEDKNMNLGDESEATSVWSSAVDDYFRGNYASASAGFAKASQLYGFNGYAEPLQKLASIKQGSDGDTSLMNQFQSVMIGVLAVSILVTVVLSVLYVLQKRRLDALRVGHYGAVDGFSQPIQPQQVVTPQPQQWQSQQSTAPQQVQQAQYPEYQQQPPLQQQYPQQMTQQNAQPPVQPYQQPYQQPTNNAPIANQQPAQPSNQQVPNQAPEDPFYRQ
jgi:flagellar basal body-associated protein FliL